MNVPHVDDVAALPELMRKSNCHAANGRRQRVADRHADADRMPVKEESRGLMHSHTRPQISAKKPRAYSSLGMCRVTVHLPSRLEEASGKKSLP